MINTTIDSIVFPNIKICQPDKKSGFRFGSDSVILSYFSRIKSGSFVADVGSGSGVIAALISSIYDVNVVAIEIQEEIFSCLKETINLSNLNNKITPINCDILEYKKDKSFDVVISNPPYRKIGTGKISENETESKARFSYNMDLESLLKFSKSNLKYGGKLCFSYDADMSVDAISICRNYNFEPKRLRFVYPDINKQAKLILIECVFGGGKEINIEPPLFQAGIYSDEYTNIFRGVWK